MAHLSSHIQRVILCGNSCSIFQKYTIFSVFITSHLYRSSMCAGFTWCRAFLSANTLVAPNIWMFISSEKKNGGLNAFCKHIKYDYYLIASRTSKAANAITCFISESAWPPFLLLIRLLLWLFVLSSFWMYKQIVVLFDAFFFWNERISRFRCVDLMRYT